MRTATALLDADPRSFLRFSHEAMATRFEVIFPSGDSRAARYAAAETFETVDRLERQLTRFDPCSEVAQINRLRIGESMSVAPEVYECLSIAFVLRERTAGAFDPTLGAVVRCWRHDDGTRRSPSAGELAAARSRTGRERLLLVAGEFAVRRECDGEPEGTAPTVEIDLGGIGKGYALDQAAEVLEGWDQPCALLNAGSSTVLALGAPGTESGWPVAVGGDWARGAEDGRVYLRDSALSGSGSEVQGNHVLDPGTGYPATGHLAAWALCPSAAVADALSTAFMVMSTENVRAFRAAFPEVAACVVEPAGGGRLIRIGRE